MHEPSTDQVFTPLEFVVTSKSMGPLSPAGICVYRHVTVGFVAAATELAVAPPNKPATINTVTRRIALDRISEAYGPIRPITALGERTDGYEGLLRIVKKTG